MLKKILLMILAFIFAVNTASAQDSKERDVQKLFIKIEEGLTSGSVDKFSNYFSGRNYISLSNGTSGYFSSNQSYYVIKDYLSVFQPISFKFTNIVADSGNPFAAGSLKFNNKGIRGTATVFVTLNFSDNEWRISQITISQY